MNLPASSDAYDDEAEDSGGTEEPAEHEQYEIEMEVERAMARLRGEQSYLLALAGGLASSVVAAMLWAVIAVVTGYAIGFMAIGVGFLVGISVRALGKGIDKSFGYIGAAFSLLGCVAGNLLMICALFAQQENVGFFEVLLQLTPVSAAKILYHTFDVMDVVFYGLALFQGYRFSFRQVTEADLMPVET